MREIRTSGSVGPPGWKTALGHPAFCFFEKEKKQNSTPRSIFLLPQFGGAEVRPASIVPSARECFERAGQTVFDPVERDTAPNPRNRGKIIAMSRIIWFTYAFVRLTGGPAGVNENLAISGVITIGGSVTAAGDQGLTWSPVATIYGDLSVRGPLTYPSVTTVDRNVWLGGGLLGSGVLTVGWDLRQVSGAVRSPTAFINLSGRDLREPVSVQSPCARGDRDILDIAGMVREAKAHNHNAEAGFDSHRLENASSAETVELPCGKIFVSNIKATGPLQLLVHGRSALFVESDADCCEPLICSQGRCAVDIL
jgi:hypothetical protein